MDGGKETCTSPHQNIHLTYFIQVLLKTQNFLICNLILFKNRGTKTPIRPPAQCSHALTLKCPKYKIVTIENHTSIAPILTDSTV